MGNIKVGNKENLIHKSLRTSKSNLSFWQNTIKANEMVCDIMKNGYCLPNFYTPSNVEFSKNSLVFKNSVFVDESIKEMLTESTTKEFHRT